MRTIFSGVYSIYQGTYSPNVKFRKKINWISASPHLLFIEGGTDHVDKGLPLPKSLALTPSSVLSVLRPSPPTKSSKCSQVMRGIPAHSPPEKPKL